MGYLKAETVLPAELLEAVQQHVDGAYIYIPRRDSNKKAWGELKRSKEKLSQRNSAIVREYRAGRSVRELAASYFLSDKTIYKVLSRHG